MKTIERVGMVAVLAGLAIATVALAMRAGAEGGEEIEQGSSSEPPAVIMPVHEHTCEVPVTAEVYIGTMTYAETQGWDLERRVGTGTMTASHAHEPMHAAHGSINISDLKLGRHMRMNLLNDAMGVWADGCLDHVWPEWESH